MRLLVAGVAGLLVIAPGQAAEPAAADSAAACAAEADDARRLACYDRVFRPAPVAEPGGAVRSRSPVDAAPESGGVGQLMSKAWELTPADKRGTFIVRTYLPNFVLPLHHSSDINRTPSSPTHPADAPGPHSKRTEVKLQISLRAKVAEGLLLPDADLWFAYTQRSMWQLWAPEDSSPFRSSDYQPEAIYVIPVAPRFAALPGDWRWRLLQLGLAHQSNGQRDPLSRSWNRASVGTAFEHGDFGLQAQLHRRLPEGGVDDNPDLTSYIGRGELTLSWLPGRATASATWRTTLHSFDRGSLQLDLTYPVDSDQPAGLRWYAQFFHGFGETLLDYNHRRTSFGFGLSLFQF